MDKAKSKIEKLKEIKKYNQLMKKREEQFLKISLAPKFVREEIKKLKEKRKKQKQLEKYKKDLNKINRILKKLQATKKFRR